MRITYQITQIQNLSLFNVECIILPTAVAKISSQNTSSKNHNYFDFLRMPAVSDGAKIWLSFSAERLSLFQDLRLGFYVLWFHGKLTKVIWDQ